jgi:hypothetical protein
MNILFSASNATPVVLPVNLLFWLNAIAYAMHILEESLVPEVFVDKMKRGYFPAYTWRKFFGFNAILLSINILAVIVYESLGGAWIIFPLAMLVERVLNGVWHLGEMIVTKRYSSGVLMSTVAWIAMYLLVRYALLKYQIPTQQFITACIIGLIIDLLMMVPTYLGAYKKMK